MKNRLFWFGVFLFLVPVSSAFSFDTIAPEVAYIDATTDPNTFILDVRTIAEWKWVGHPGKNGLGEGVALEGKVINVSFKIETIGGLVTNEHFLSEVNELFEDNPNVTLITMCMTGGRGAAAAAILENQGGYNVKNMAYGFQGPADSRGYRTLFGWVNDDLPYTYTGLGYQD